MEIIGFICSVVFISIVLKYVFEAILKEDKEFENLKNIDNNLKESNVQKESLKGMLETKKRIGSKFYGLEYRDDCEVVENPQELFRLLDKVKFEMYDCLDDNYKSQTKVVGSIHDGKDTAKYVFGKIEILEIFMKKYFEKKELGLDCKLIALTLDTIVQHGKTTTMLEKILLDENYLNAIIVALEIYDSGVMFTEETYDLYIKQEPFSVLIDLLMKQAPGKEIPVLLTFLYYEIKQELYYCINYVTYNLYDKKRMNAEQLKIIGDKLVNNEKNVTQEMVDRMNYIYSRDKKYFS